MVDRIANWKSACKGSKVPAAPICGIETGALHLGKTIHLNVSFTFLVMSVKLSTKKVRPGVHAAEVAFLLKISSFSLLDKV